MRTSDPVLLCKLVVHAVAADRVIDPQETALIDRLISHFELDESQREAILLSVNEDVEPLLAALLESPSRDDLIAAIALAVAVDGVIEERELAMLERVANAAGMTSDELDDLIAAAMLD